MISLIGIVVLLVGVALVAALVEREFDIVGVRLRAKAAADLARRQASANTITLRYGPYL